MTNRLNYFAASPDGMQALNAVHLYIDRCGLPAALINLVYLRVSQINGCSYCISIHSRDLMKKGVPAPKLLLLQTWRESGTLFSKKEQAALAWAEVLTRIAETRDSDAEYEVVSAEFTAKELTDLTYAIGLMNAYNRIAIGFAQGPDPSFLKNASM